MRIAANGTIKREFERDVEKERLVHVPRTFYVRVYVVEYKAHLLVTWPAPLAKGLYKSPCTLGRDPNCTSKKPKT